LWVGTYEGGLARLNANKEWTLFNHETLPCNIVNTIANDGNGGVWIGTAWVSKGSKEDGMIGSGLAHLSPSGEWAFFTTDDSDLPDNFINSLVSDGKGGVWIGTGGVSFSFSKTVAPSGSGDRILENGESVSIPQGEYVLTVTKAKGGLAYLSEKREWTIFNAQNSDLPNQHVAALVSDGNDGLWIGTYDLSVAITNTARAIGATFTSRGLTRLSSTGEWTVANTTQSGFPYSNVITLVGDNKGGLWLGTEWDGLVHLSTHQDWTAFNKANSSLPDNFVTALTTDHKGGLWVGTKKGLVYKDDSGDRHFNVDNSRLPDNKIVALVSDHRVQTGWALMEVA
jgi:ligand-binding sensor domain-containing protein